MTSHCINTERTAATEKLVPSRVRAMGTHGIEQLGVSLGDVLIESRAQFSLTLLAGTFGFAIQTTVTQ